MENFHRVNHELFCEKVALKELAQVVGTPTYVYSRQSIQNGLDRFTGAFESSGVRICYSVKSNSNLSILNMMARNGVGADIVSGGELFRALKAGIDPKKIVYSGVGKTAEELHFALKSGIGMINIESEPELLSLAQIAEETETVVSIACRINPDIDAGAHHYTTTAKKENKFGLPLAAAFELYKKAHAMPYINPVGVDVHLGSPIHALEPYQKALVVLESFIGDLRAAGIMIAVLDIGGGYGIRYNDENPFTPVQFAGLIQPYLERLGCELIIEPGRCIVGNAGVLLTRLTYCKKTETKQFYIGDAGMNDLIRPPLYGSYHGVAPVVSHNRPLTTVDVVGPICESSDFFAKDRQVETMQQGELLAVMSTGAYGFTMSSNYNSRPRAAEVLVDGSQYSIIRKRETYDDLISGEAITW